MHRPSPAVPNHFLHHTSHVLSRLFSSLSSLMEATRKAVSVCAHRLRLFRRPLTGRRNHPIVRGLLRVPFTIISIVAFAVILVEFEVQRDILFKWCVCRGTTDMNAVFSVNSFPLSISP